MFLFYDTETTGLPDFKAPSEAPHQPHMVQLAAVLVDPTTRKAVQSLDVIIQPAGWQISEEVAAVHGISHERATLLGVEEHAALSLFLQLWRRCARRIGHNEQFDARILRIAMMRYGIQERLIEDFHSGPTECTQRLATPIMKLPPTAKMVAAGRNHSKSANLSEAYEYFTGKPLVDAHSAMADALACAEVYWAIKDGAAAAA